MGTSTGPTFQSWLKFTVLNGFAAMISYTAAAFAPLPEMLSLILAFAFGPFFMLSSLGLYRIARSWRDSLSLQTGVLFNIVGTAFVTMMLVVQQTIFAFHDQFKTSDRGAVSEEQLRWMFREVNSVQLGWTSHGTFLFLQVLFS